MGFENNSALTLLQAGQDLSHINTQLKQSNIFLRHERKMCKMLMPVKCS